MIEVMTPSTHPMTPGQIEKATSQYRSLLLKHQAELGSEAAQLVLGQPEYVADLVEVLRKRVRLLSDSISCRVSVDQTRSPIEAITATGCRKYIAPRVANTMPRGADGTVRLFLFKAKHPPGHPDLDKEYEVRGLVPANPYSLIALNENNPRFLDDYPNGTFWKGISGNRNHIAFCRSYGQRCVFVGDGGISPGSYWWIVGVMP